MCVVLAPSITMAKLAIALVLAVATFVAASPRRPNFPHGRIIGGTNAPDGAYPYQISLRLYGGTFHTCGGSIVDKEWIVTAAHCVEGSSPSDFQVYVGSTKLDGDGTYYNVQEVHWHENYDAWNIKNDVAILKVDPITFTDKVAPIALDSEQIGDGQPLTVSGWGTDNLSVGSSPNDLQHLNVTAIESSYCADQEVCTSTPAGQGTCFGDSGGPLVRNVDGTLKQVGVVSWVYPCALGMPDGYARVSYFYDWFKEKCNCV